MPDREIPSHVPSPRLASIGRLMLFGVVALGGGIDAASAQVAEAPDLGGDGEITVTARRVSESLQDVPIAVSVVGGEQIADSGAFNVNRLTRLMRRRLKIGMTNVA